MVVQFAFLHIVLILWSIYPLASAQDNIIAQPGCNSTCGGVDIPYPFGMTNHSCYADKWFEIECRNNTPFLKLIDNLEVTDIDVYRGTVTIMNPIYRRNCQSKDATRCIDMRGSPFVYSQGMNKFVGMGCNNLALLVSNGSKVGGCVSICDNNDEYLSKTYLGSDGCLGRSCCQTSLPMYLSEYYATFEDIRRNTGATDECRYALIVGDYYLGGMNLSAYLKDLDYVPASLEWEILNSTLRLPFANCYETNITSSEKKHSGRRCDCGLGFDGNPYVSGGCTAIAGSTIIADIRRKNRANWVTLGILLSLGFVVFNVFLGSKILRRRRIQKRKEKYFKQNGGFLLKQRLSSGEIQTKLFDLKDLEKATNCFNVSKVLGKGGQGTVYKGMLVDGQIVAVKKFRVQGNVEGFINEVVILSQINHRNVVKLLGVCLETEVPLLVYEFISNGNLFQYLHDQNEDLPMTWEMRVRIATEVAGALHYLHSAASQPIYHRDVKSTNILLDEKYSAKVADFGTSRMVTIEATHLTTLVRGTFGYLDPEYFHTSQFTEKSDVYSFGVVLVELLTGQKPIFSTRTEEAENLASYFMMSMAEDRLFDILDRKIMEGENEEITAVAKLAGRCLELNGRKRPTMKEVTKYLEGIQKWGKRSDIAEQDHEKIAAFGIEAYHRWAVDSASTGSTLNSKASSSSAMNEEVQSN